MNRKRCYWAQFNRLQFRMSGEEVDACSHSGQCDADVDHYAPQVYARACREIGKRNPWFPTPENMREELMEYGAWSEEELQDDAQNWKRLVWLGAGNIRDEDEPDCTPPCKTSKAEVTP